ncbi:MAG: Ig-like domain-containing protein [Prevotellaceae bacterium]|nr:Ig-like domain-containing protein [Prevotellaceae bacterium]
MKQFINYIIILIGIIYASGCANISNSLSGGAKDTIAPVILKEIPMYDEKNVTAKQIEITFNEYVKIKDRTSFIVSPPLKSAPVIFTRGKRVIAQYDSTLNQNTTYLFDFGSAIVDLNEGNPLGDYRLRFSTGDIIDSLHLSGRARHAFTFDSVKNMKILLYKDNTDSLPFTTPPDAVALVSQRGFFVVDALKDQPYRIIAVEDKNNNNIYDAGEMVGFLDSMMRPVTFGSDTMTVGDYERDSISTFDYLPLVRIFQENINRQYLVEYKREQERKVVLYFAQHYPEIHSIDFFSSDSVALDSEKIIVEKSFFGDTVTYWFANDSVPPKMYAEIVYVKPDSTDVDMPTNAMLRFKDFVKQDNVNRKSKKNDKEEKDEIPKLQVATRVNETRVMETGFNLVFNAPLTNIDYEKISLYKMDEEGKNPKKIAFEINPDTSNLCNYVFNTDKWESGLIYNVEFLAGAFKDIYNLENDSVNKKIQTPNIDKFSTIQLDFTNVECNYIVQLMQNNKTVQTKQTDKNGILTISFIVPDTYSIKIIEDKNNNNRWDTGSLKKRLQPERVKLYKLADGKTTLKLRQGWENVLPIDVKELFAE